MAKYLTLCMQGLNNTKVVTSFLNHPKLNSHEQ
ncbi:MAG: hypothetical protein RL172_1761 [Bacteroidota bacterium]|jgi:hypothetical protein